MLWIESERVRMAHMPGVNAFIIRVIAGLALSEDRPDKEEWFQHRFMQLPRMKDLN